MAKLSNCFTTVEFLLIQAMKKLQSTCWSEERVSIVLLHISW